MSSTREGRGAPVRLGVLGCADIAWRRVLPAVATTPSVRLVAVASRDAAKAERFADRFGGAAVTGYENLLAREDLDAVYVPLPVALRHEWVGRALAAGLHVLSEKPLTTGPGSSAELLAEAERRNLTVMENFAFRYHRQHHELRRLVAEGAIGRPRALMCEFGVPQRAPGDIRHDPALGGGALLDVGVYPLALAQFLWGGGLRVGGAVLERVEDTGVDVRGGALLSAPDGGTAQAGFGFGLHYRNEYTVWGDSGTLRLDRAFTPPETLRPTLELRTGSAAEDLPLEPDHQFRNLLDAFADGVRGAAPVDTSPVLELAGLVDRVRRSAAEAAAV
ncbi:Gfo/Idh/MocA family oxidoreductase [Nocardiopsis tropica]|uniref:Gfo/Idh/MocA family oxidoreductase n=1 Tax=Nocardiopsis tropica TaxID=109330 RepID=A0ABU7KU34_9ACTN|nr:Gfo/Idh/MocA family oxidoreductase [Nocardiopsis umidischolae]MEE2052794.1 Gfo/Idh/MocA family oxidoreductase [Nocardiopsis umidischolae]